MKDTSKEKRRFPRFPVGLTMDILARGQAAGRVRGTIADLSASGMTFRSDAVLETGMCLHLRVDPALQIRGEIRNINEAPAGGMRRYGVRFHKIEGDLKAKGLGERA